MKSANCISATGRMPMIAAPVQAPTIAVSASGASMTRQAPNSSWNPSVTLKGPAVDAHVLADDEDALVAPHLGAQPVGDRLEVRELGHYLWCGVSRSSGVAYTPSASVDGSGSGDSSARVSASLSVFFTPALISSSSSSDISAFSRSQPRKRSIGSFSAQRSNISFGT